jgi:hypothetical protein
MAIFIDTTSRSTKGAFKGETVDKVELTPHYNTGCWLTSLLDYKVAILEAELFCVSTKQEWEYALFESVRFEIRASIHEEVFLPRMTMKVTKEKDISTL